MPAQPGSPDRRASYLCPFCRRKADLPAASCEHCGAPVDVRTMVSRSGWQSQPPIPDMARLRFGGSSCQIEGVVVPIADFNLAASQGIYFPHHHLLWCDPTIVMAARRMAGGWSRMYRGVPLVMLQAVGPGHIALSDDSAGEVIAVPVDQDRAVVVAEHRFLAATDNVDYQWQPSHLCYQTQKRDDWELHYPVGRYLDLFRALSGPGFVLLHAPGNTFVRVLQPEETICAQPSALVYADSSVRTHLHFEVPKGAKERYMRPGASHLVQFVWLKIRGPGRVALQSVFERPEATGPPVNIRESGHTSAGW